MVGTLEVVLVETLGAARVVLVETQEAAQVVLVAEQAPVAETLKAARAETPVVAETPVLSAMAGSKPEAQVAAVPQAAAAAEAVGLALVFVVVYQLAHRATCSTHCRKPALYPRAQRLRPTIRELGETHRKTTRPPH